MHPSILYFLRDKLREDVGFIEENLNDICASVQTCIVEILIDKSEKAINTYSPQGIALAGGVAANSGLRAAFEELAEKHGLPSYIPAFEYCTDNAAMIAMTGHFMHARDQYSGLDTIPIANLRL